MLVRHILSWSLVISALKGFHVGGTTCESHNAEPALFVCTQGSQELATNVIYIDTGGAPTYQAANCECHLTIVVPKNPGASEVNVQASYLSGSVLSEDYATISIAGTEFEHDDDDDSKTFTFPAATATRTLVLRYTQTDSDATSAACLNISATDQAHKFKVTCYRAGETATSGRPTPTRAGTTQPSGQFSTVTGDDGAVDKDRSGSGDNGVGLAVGLGVGCVALIVLAVVMVILIRRQRSKRQMESAQDGDMETENPMYNMEYTKTIPPPNGVNTIKLEYSYCEPMDKTRAGAHPSNLAVAEELHYAEPDDSIITGDYSTIHARMNTDHKSVSDDVDTTYDHTNDKHKPVPGNEYSKFGRTNQFDKKVVPGEDDYSHIDNTHPSKHQTQKIVPDNEYSHIGRADKDNDDEYNHIDHVNKIPAQKVVPDNEYSHIGQSH